MSERAARLPLSSAAVEPARDEQLVETAKRAALGGLVRDLAHEINNPLFGILGLVEFLIAEVEPGTKAHERARLIQESGLEIKEIVQALLTFAREDPQEAGPVPLQAPASAAVELLRSTNAAKTVEIVERYPAEPLLVEGSGSRLAQLFLHVLVNAQQAGGGRVEVELDRDGEWIVGTVSDDGPGISEPVRARIFEPFFSTKGARRQPSSGLGLAASLEIARAHGGDLAAVAPPVRGCGACFRLRLPRAREGAA